jgi:hypothetical protein
MNEDLSVVLASIETAISNIDSTVHPEIFKTLQRAWRKTYQAWKQA